MAKLLYDYDPAAALSSPEAIEVFMADAFETGVSREQLYRSFSNCRGWVIVDSSCATKADRLPASSIKKQSDLDAWRQMQKARSALFDTIFEQRPRAA